VKKINLGNKLDTNVSWLWPILLGRLFPWEIFKIGRRKLTPFISKTNRDYDYIFNHKKSWYTLKHVSMSDLYLF
jgi:hypothetical protein